MDRRIILKLSVFIGIYLGTIITNIGVFLISYGILKFLGKENSLNIAYGTTFFCLICANEVRLIKTRVRLKEYGILTEKD